MPLLHTAGFLQKIQSTVHTYAGAGGQGNTSNLFTGSPLGKEDAGLASHYTGDQEAGPACAAFLSPSVLLVVLTQGGALLAFSKSRSQERWPGNPLPTPHTKRDMAHTRSLRKQEALHM